MADERTLFYVFMALMVLLAATIIASLLPIGPWSLPVSLTIAALKAGLVAWYFMNLRGNPPLVRIVGLAGVLWLGFLLLITFSDYLTRGGIHVLGK